MTFLFFCRSTAGDLSRGIDDGLVSVIMPSEDDGTRWLPPEYLNEPAIEASTHRKGLGPFARTAESGFLLSPVSASSLEVPCEPWSSILSRGLCGLRSRSLVSPRGLGNRQGP